MKKPNNFLYKYGGSFRITLICLAFAAGMFTLAGCGSKGGAGPDPHIVLRTISGTVYLGTQASGADPVVYLKKGEATLATVNPDAHGYYEFLDVAEGNNYYIEAYLLGYQQISPDPFDPTDPFTNFKLQSDITLDVKLQALDVYAETYEISGTVYEADGTTPISGVKVWAKIPGSGIKSLSRTTIGDGTYFIDNLPPGQYVIEASKDLYQEGSSDETFLSENTAGIKLKLDRLTYTLSGTITTEYPNGVAAGAEITLLQDAVPVPGKKVIADSKGAYTVPDVAWGTNFKIKVDFPDYNSANESGAFNITADKTQDLKLTRLVYTISGTVVEAGSTDPVGGVTVWLDDRGKYLTTETDIDGKYSFDFLLSVDKDLHSISYNIYTNCENYQSTTIENITITGNKTQPIEIQKIGSGVRISGTVKTSDDASAAGALITLSSTHSSKVYYTVSGAQGAFYLVVEEDEYNLQINLVNYDLLKGVINADATKNLGALQIIRTVYTITGTVVKDYQTNSGINDKVSGARVQLKLNGVNVGTQITTDANGAFAIHNVLPGNGGYSLSITHSLTKDTIYPNVGTFAMTGNLDITEIELKEITYSVSGRVLRGSTNFGLQNATVRLKRMTGAFEVVEIKTSENGSYKFNNVRPSGTSVSGAYKIEAECGGYLKGYLENDPNYTFAVLSTDRSVANFALVQKPDLADSPSYNWISVDLRPPQVLSGYKDYDGPVIKLGPGGLSMNGNWGPANRNPIIWQIKKPVGSDPAVTFYTVTITMSFMAERPSPTSYVGKHKMFWMYNNGTNFDDFANREGKGYEITEFNKWHEVTFSGSITLSDTEGAFLTMDAYAVDRGGEPLVIDSDLDGTLGDAILYIRGFNVTTTPAKKYIAMTFDDGPTDLSYTLLDALKTAPLGSVTSPLPSTFFIVGMRIDARCPNLDANLTLLGRQQKALERMATVKRMYLEGHDVGNHTYTHNYLGVGSLDGKDGIDSGLSPSDIPVLGGFTDTVYPLTVPQIQKEINYCWDRISAAIGDTVPTMGTSIGKSFSQRWFRTPFTTMGMPLSQATQGIGIPIIHGEGTEDYTFKDVGGGPTQLAQIDILYNNMMTQARPWGVIINHDPHFSPNIIAALRKVVPDLIAEGYEFVTLTRMEELRAVPAGEENKLKSGWTYNNFDVNYDPPGPNQ